MKKKTLLFTAAPLIGALLLAGCGGSDAQVQGASYSNVSSAPVSEITIAGNDQMRFSITEFTVAAGSEVAVTFQNIGKMPKEAMGHNLAILDKGVDPMAFANAATRHVATEYVPPEYNDRVIAATKVLGPGQEETLTFTAPSQVGDYPFVCSFPGHTPAGMRGVMKVK